MRVTVTQKRFVLGVTSWWILVPVMESLRQYETNIALAGTALVAACVSAVTYHFLDTQFAWILHLDRVVAVALFALLCLSEPTASSARLPWAFGVAALFCASKIAESHCGCATSLIAHLAFRYAGFWWLWDRLVRTHDPRHMLVLSIAYWTHSCFLVRSSALSFRYVLALTSMLVLARTASFSL